MCSVSTCVRCPPGALHLAARYEAQALAEQLMNATPTSSVVSDDDLFDGPAGFSSGFANTSGVSGSSVSFGAWRFASRCISALHSHSPPHRDATAQSPTDGGLSLAVPTPRPAQRSASPDFEKQAVPASATPRTSALSASIAADRARDGVMQVHQFSCEAGDWVQVPMATAVAAATPQPEEAAPPPTPSDTPGAPDVDSAPPPPTHTAQTSISSLPSLAPATGMQYRWQMTQMLASCSVGEVLRGLVRLCNQQGGCWLLPGQQPAPAADQSSCGAASSAFQLRVAEDGEADFDFPCLPRTAKVAGLGEEEFAVCSADSQQEVLQVRLHHTTSKAGKSVLRLFFRHPPPPGTEVFDPSPVPRGTGSTPTPSPTACPSSAAPEHAHTSAGAATQPAVPTAQPLRLWSRSGEVFTPVPVQATPAAQTSPARHQDAPAFALSDSEDTSPEGDGSGSGSGAEEEEVETGGRGSHTGLQVTYTSAGGEGGSFGGALGSVAAVPMGREGAGHLAAHTAQVGAPGGADMMRQIAEYRRARYGRQPPASEQGVPAVLGKLAAGLSAEPRRRQLLESDEDALAAAIAAVDGTGSQAAAPSL